MHLVRQVWVGGGDRIHMFGRRENGEVKGWEGELESICLIWGKRR